MSRYDENTGRPSYTDDLDLDSRPSARRSGARRSSAGGRTARASGGRARSRDVAHDAQSSAADRSDPYAETGRATTSRPSRRQMPAREERMADRTYGAEAPYAAPVAGAAVTAGVRGDQGAEAAARPRGSARVGSLEGLRALAIVSVVLYHLGVNWLPSGHMGVVMFLVLAGYLATGSLVRMFERAGRIDLKSFWLRRLKRIWPPMAVMIVVVAAVCVFANHVLLTKMRPDILPSLLFFSNWSYILSGASYFDAIGGPSPLTHLWYLGVDAQAMVILPLLVLLAMRVIGWGRRGLRRMLLALAVVSAVLMAVLFDPGADPSRVYYGVDTRIFSVLLGGWLACAWPLGGQPVAGRDLLVRDDISSETGMRAAPLVDCVATGALAVLVVIMVVTPATSAFFYYGGMLLVSVLVVCLIAGLAAPGGVLGRAFSARPLVWLGSRSFALYLWHYPIIQLLGATGGAPWWLKLIAALLSLAVAEATCRFVEGPLADGRAAAGASGLLEAVRSHVGLRDAVARRYVGAPFLASVGAGVTALLVAGVGCAAVPETTLVPEEAIVSTGDAVDEAVDLTGASDEQQSTEAAITTLNFDVPYDQMTDEQKAQVQAEIKRLADEAREAQHQTSDAALATVRARLAETGPATTGIPSGSLQLHTAVEEAQAGLVEPLLVGDSVPGDTNSHLVWLDGHNDSFVGRNPSQALSVLKGYLDQYTVGNVVVLASFTNMGAMTDTYRQMVEACGDRQVFLVGIVCPDGNQEEVNTALYSVAGEYANAHYVDWPSVCANNPSGYLWGDETHLTPRGAAAYVDMISQAIAPYMVAEGGTATAYTWDTSYW